jgi:hypothetical protein
VKTLDARVTITRNSRDEIWIYIQDYRASANIVEVKMTTEAFALAVTGLGSVEATAEFNDSGNVGMVAQNKTEMVPIPSSGKTRGGEWEAKALAPFEVNGWRARSGDISNHHRWSRDKNGQEWQSVVFFRHVTVEAAEAEERKKAKV